MTCGILADQYASVQKLGRLCGTGIVLCPCPSALPMTALVRLLCRFRRLARLELYGVVPGLMRELKRGLPQSLRELHLRDVSQFKVRPWAWPHLKYSCSFRAVLTDHPALQ